MTDDGRFPPGLIEFALRRRYRHERRVCATGTSRSSPVPHQPSARSYSYSGRRLQAGQPACAHHRAITIHRFESAARRHRPPARPYRRVRARPRQPGAGHRVSPGSWTDGARIADLALNCIVSPVEVAECRLPCYGRGGRVMGCSDESAVRCGQVPPDCQRPSGQDGCGSQCRVPVNGARPGPLTCGEESSLAECLGRDTRFARFWRWPGLLVSVSRSHLLYLGFLQNSIEAPRQKMRILVGRVICPGLRYAVKPARCP